MYFVLTLVMYLVAGGLAIYFFALIDFCWTMIEEGEIVTIMVNKKAWKFIGSIKGHLVNEETGEVTLGDEKFPWYSLKNLGIYWMGFWPFFRRYVYRFKWVKYSKTNDPNGVTYNFEARDAMVSTLLFRFPYGFKFEAVETKGKIGLVRDQGRCARRDQRHRHLGRPVHHRGRCRADGALQRIPRDLRHAR